MLYLFDILANSLALTSHAAAKSLRIIISSLNLLFNHHTSIRLDFSVENPDQVYEITKAYIDMKNFGDYYLNLNDVTYGYYLDNDNN